MHEPMLVPTSPTFDTRAANSQSAARRASATAWRDAVSVRPRLGETRYSDRSSFRRFSLVMVGHAEAQRSDSRVLQHPA